MARSGPGVYLAVTEFLRARQWQVWEFARKAVCFACHVRLQVSKRCRSAYISASSTHTKTHALSNEAFQRIVCRPCRYCARSTRMHDHACACTNYTHRAHARTRHTHANCAVTHTHSTSVRAQGSRVA
eukprot:2479872-Pleurochrysis_carterae.AAC.1